MQRERSKWGPHKDLSTQVRHRDGPGRMSEEVPVMGMEQRPWVIQRSTLVNQRWEEPMEKARPFAIPKQAVWTAYKKVRANQGAAGIDDVSIEAFDRDLKDNLYKLWNRLSSGSYFPPHFLSALHRGCPVSSFRSVTLKAMPPRRWPVLSGPDRVNAICGSVATLCTHLDAGATTASPRTSLPSGPGGRPFAGNSVDEPVCTNPASDIGARRRVHSQRMRQASDSYRRVIRCDRRNPILCIGSSQNAQLHLFEVPFRAIDRCRAVLLRIVISVRFGNSFSA